MLAPPSRVGEGGGSVASYVDGGVGLPQHGSSIIVEDDLDRHWQASTGEPVVDEVIFSSWYTIVTNRSTLTVHPIDGSISSLPPATLQ